MPHGSSSHTSQLIETAIHAGDPALADDLCLDTVQLTQLEQSFRIWTDESPRRDVRLSRRRMLLVFLLIRYTGAKLSEILRLDPFTDIEDQFVCIRDLDGAEPCLRRVSIAESLGREIKETLADPDIRAAMTNLFAIDPAFVRRKFYERAEDCGFARRLGGPEMIRRARAVELVRGNMPLPAVQKLLGQATPSLTTARVSFSEAELQRLTTLYIKRESSRTTSARNAFFGKIEVIERGDVQVRITMVTRSGHRVVSIITQESLDRLGLRPGLLITAEVKAPWILLGRGQELAACSADNRFAGEIVRINRGKVSSEYVVRIEDGTELCALTATSSGDRLACAIGDLVWVVFNGFAVILHADQ